MLIFFCPSISYSGLCNRTASLHRNDHAMTKERCFCRGVVRDSSKKFAEKLRNG